ncbi:MAG: hypothetical protein WKG03_19980, partial [Telluria sp.]
MHPLFSTAVLALAAGASVAAAAPVTLRVHAQESMPPKWVVGNRQQTGVCPDIMAAIEKVEPRVRFSRKVDTRS